MGDDRNRILDLLASGRITVEEATRLLEALDAKAGKSDGTDEAAAAAKTGWPRFFNSAGKIGDKPVTPGSAKFLRVKVVSEKGDNVNVKIPLGVVRAGLKLTTLIPKPASEQINKAMAEKGMTFDLNTLKPQDLEELVESLAEMEIEVLQGNGDTVKVYAE